MTPADVVWACAAPGAADRRHWQDALPRRRLYAELSARFIAKIKEKIAQGLALRASTTDQRPRASDARSVRAGASKRTRAPRRRGTVTRPSVAISDRVVDRWTCTVAPSDVGRPGSPVRRRCRRRRCARRTVISRSATASAGATSGPRHGISGAPMPATTEPAGIDTCPPRADRSTVAASNRSSHRPSRPS